MKSSIETQILFYNHLGKLFYSIAAVDKTIVEEEINTLKQIVNTDWLALDGAKDKSEVDAMRQIKIAFEQLKQQEVNVYSCLKEFKTFKELHPYLFTDEVKQLIWKTVNSIASSFARKNKSELVFLSKLAALLKD